jgi:hypothetical protein
MLGSSELWLTPLILLPGVALLVLSTSIRYGRIHDEFHDLEAHADHSSPQTVRELERRAMMFRNALVSLYASVTLLALASLLGGLATYWIGGAGWLSAGLTLAAIAGLVFAAAQLARECALSYGVIRDHASRLMQS